MKDVANDNRTIDARIRKKSKTEERECRIDPLIAALPIGP